MIIPELCEVFALWRREKACLFSTYEYDMSNHRDMEHFVYFQMMKKFKNKYRTTSARLQNWDYSWKGGYFLTICTKDKAHYFGSIENEKMQLSSVGIIADILWHEIKNHTPSHILLGEFVVMPNHIHGILIIEDDGLPREIPSSDQTIGKKRWQNQGKNTVSSIMGGYKSAVTKHARRLGKEFGWQTKFWDHIIRRDEDYVRIVEYIKNNPEKWETDKLNGGAGNAVLEPRAEYGDDLWMI